MGAKRRVVDEERRAVRADALVLVAEGQEHVRVVIGRQCADAHEVMGADLDPGKPFMVVNVKDCLVGHDNTRFFFLTVVA